MKSSWIKYSNKPTPRYTSYPSALRFSEEITPTQLSDKLQATSLYEPLSIYVHVPFCQKLCWYCGCNMRVENSYRRALYYVDALLDEIRIVGGFLKGHGRTVNVHFGGGTPNYLKTEDLGRILGTIELELGLTDDSRLAIELDPRLVHGEDIARLAAIGFSRMSLGVQDFDPIVQQAINRIQSFELIEQCVSAMRQTSINDISFDLLYGLPHQTLKSFTRSIAKTIALAPDRVSVFGYAHLPSALPRQRMIRDQDLPGPSLRSDLAALADEKFQRAGYIRIGFDHYAKPDNPLANAFREKRLRRNFQGFTDDIATTSIGLGASAISFIDGLYAQNQKDIRGYCAAIKRRQLPTIRGIMRSPKDTLIATAIDQLLCEYKTELNGVFEVLPSDEIAKIKNALTRMENDGILTLQDGTITMNEGAYSLCRAVASTFDPYINTTVSMAKAI